MSNLFGDSPFDRPLAWLSLATAVLVLGTPAAGAAPPTDPAEARAERQSAVVEVAPAPPATGHALLGPAGWDATGQPAQYVDGPGLRTLLHKRRFAELEAHLAYFQSQAEADARRSVWLVDAVAALASPLASAVPVLDAWVQASPHSFAPWLVRGGYRVTVAHALRGTRFTGKTADSDFQAMRAALPGALTDLDRALQLRPRLAVARAYQIKAHQLGSELADIAKVAGLALTECPGCLQPRIAYVQALRPRWGGSYAAMVAVIRATPVVAHPHLQAIGGYIDFDRANVHSRGGRHAEALAALDRACGVAEHAPFLIERALARKRVGDLPGGLKDLERAAALRPGDPEVATARVSLLMATKRYEEAGLALLAALRTDPTDSTARSWHADVVQGVLVAGWQHQTAGRRDAALKAYDLAAELAPGHREAIRRRAWLLAQQDRRTEAVPAAMQQAAAQNPDDFRAVQALDYALARRRRFAEVVQLWNDFLARHPRHGPAYLERGGALFHLRRLPEALADARKACELGVAEGCLRVRQLGGSP